MRVVAAVLVSVLASSGCGGGGESDDGGAESTPALEAAALAEVVDLSGDATELGLYELASGPLTLEDIASTYELSQDLVRESRFVGAWQASFQTHNAKVIRFADAAGASRFLRVLRARFEAGDYGATRPIHAGAFGREALGYTLENDPSGGRLYLWPVGSLVLEIYAPAESARAFGEHLTERAKEAG
jgi:hypothetical protein